DAQKRLSSDQAKSDSILQRQRFFRSNIKFTCRLSPCRSRLITIPKKIEDLRKICQNRCPFQLRFQKKSILPPASQARSRAQKSQRGKSIISCDEYLLSGISH